VGPVHTGIPTAGPSTEEEDKESLIRLLSSANAANQAKAIEPAMRLGTKALPTLHDQIGHRRLDVAVAAYQLLGDVAHESSIPYLTAGLYPRRTGQKMQFTTGQYAALAFRNYPADARLRVLDSINDQVRPEDIARMIEGIGPSESHGRLLRLYREKRFYRDFDQAGLSLLLRVDEDKSWPIVEELMSSASDFYAFWVFRDVYPHLSKQRQQKVIDHYLDRAQSLSSYELPRILDAVVGGSFPNEYLLSVLDRVGKAAKVAFKRYDERQEFEGKVDRIKAQVGLSGPG
jgi:hypothetical protein